ncbi:unnamed protein product [Closterium sp. NIES-53]
MAQETGDGGTAEEQSCAEVIDDHVAECSEEEALDHDDDDDVSDSGDDAVLLGFVQKPSHDWSLARHRFPSKVGGAPVSEARRMGVLAGGQRGVSLPPHALPLRLPPPALPHAPPAGAAAAATAGRGGGRQSKGKETKMHRGHHSPTKVTPSPSSPLPVISPPHPLPSPSSPLPVISPPRHLPPPSSSLPIISPPRHLPLPSSPLRLRSSFVPSSRPPMPCMHLLARPNLLPTPLFPPSDSSIYALCMLYRFCVVAVWLLCGCCVAAVWLLCGCCVAAVWLLCGCCVAAVWLLCGCCVAAVWLLCGCCVAAVWLLCGCCVAAVWLLCGCCVAAPACHCLLDFSPRGSSPCLPKDHQKEHWQAGHSAACPRTPPPTSATSPPAAPSTAVPSSAAPSSAASSAPLTPPPAAAAPSAPSQPPGTDTSAARIPSTSADAESAGGAGNDVSESDWRVTVLDRGGWKEWEMVVEEEPEEGEEGEEEGEGEEGEEAGREGGSGGEKGAGVGPGGAEVRRLMREYRERTKAEGPIAASELEGFGEGADVEKKQWAAFQAVIAKAPEQVIRYCRSATARPLWPQLQGQPPSQAAIPPCSGCGAQRIFEFQVLPQIIYYSAPDATADSALDFATLAVYVCPNSCCRSSPFSTAQQSSGTDPSSSTSTEDTAGGTSAERSSRDAGSGQAKGGEAATQHGGLQEQSMGYVEEFVWVQLPSQDPPVVASTD